MTENVDYVCLLFIILSFLENWVETPTQFTQDHFKLQILNIKVFC